VINATFYASGESKGFSCPIPFVPEAGEYIEINSGRDEDVIEGVVFKRKFTIKKVGRNISEHEFRFYVDIYVDPAPEGVE